VANWSNTLLTQLPAYKNINVKLPLEMLGKAQVYVRLIVDKNLCSDGYTYATEPIAGNVNSSIGWSYTTGEPGSGSRASIFLS